MSQDRDAASQQQRARAAARVRAVRAARRWPTTWSARSADAVADRVLVEAPRRRRSAPSCSSAGLHLEVLPGELGDPLGVDREPDDPRALVDALDPGDRGRRRRSPPSNAVHLGDPAPRPCCDARRDRPVAALLDPASSRVGQRARRSPGRPSAPSPPVPVGRRTPRDRPAPAARSSPRAARGRHSRRPSSGEAGQGRAAFKRRGLPEQRRPPPRPKPERRCCGGSPEAQAEVTAAVPAWTLPSRHASRPGSGRGR